ncbi:histidine kinase dimerization/phospho-acceptor domain-containing protein [Wukongibacter sp. M2B1]|uniref:histidine kinase dimerization/phospho-acceptor domain-containing protein n=1 Tax=Wukongibacter sp. M2B1 TaxID=3088895 RepID=UPI003D7A73EA
MIKKRELLKTPLAVVRANIDVLKDQDERAIEDYRYTLLIAEQSVNKMNALIEALPDMVQE